MKKTYTLILMICMLSSRLLAQIPNGSFETWSQNVPNSWFAALIPGYPVLVQSTDAHTGAYSVQLNVVDIGGNPYGSSLSTGSANSLYVPISYVPGAIEFWYKLTTSGGDQLSTVALVYSGGNIVALGSTSLNTASTYTQATYSITNLTGATTADSIQISFIVNNPAGGTHVGTSAIIDDVGAPLASGISNSQLAETFKIGPNPVKNVLGIKAEKALTGNVTATIYDISGRVMKTFVLTNNKLWYQVDVAELTNGTYVLHFISDGKSFSKLISVDK